MSSTTVRFALLGLLFLPFGCGDSVASVDTEGETDGTDTGNAGTTTTGPGSSDEGTSSSSSSSSSDASDSSSSTSGSGDPEDCGNSLDDDLDGDADCLDSDCATDVATCWTCDATWYDEDAAGAPPYCDCGCGIPDPDCEILPAPPLTGCEPGEVCGDDAICVPAPPESDCGDGVDNNGDGSVDCLDPTCFGETGCPPMGWSCPPAFWDEDENRAMAFCDCGCGAADPDCMQDPNAPVFGCMPGEICSEQGTCTEGSPEDCDNGIDDDGDAKADCTDTDCYGETGCPPVGWTCDPLAWDQTAPNEECDCECGVLDPDCSNAANPYGDCVAGETCNTGTLECELVPGEVCDNQGDDDGDTLVDCDDQECFGVGACPIPGWLCNPILWNSGGECDCNCGAYDPDCDDPQATIYGCPGEMVCSEMGECVPPAGWTCAVGYYGSNDGCDCGCGVTDPDCPDSTVDSCMFCDGAGSCSEGMPCPGLIDPNDNATCN